MYEFFSTCQIYAHYSGPEIKTSLKSALKSVILGSGDEFYDLIHDFRSLFSGLALFKSDRPLYAVSTDFEINGENFLDLNRVFQVRSNSKNPSESELDAIITAHIKRQIRKGIRIGHMTIPPESVTITVICDELETDDFIEQ